MSDSKDNTGVQYTMNSFNSRNVDQTNKAMGYNNMGDRANTAKVPQSMHGQKSRKQVMGKPSFK